MPGTNRKERIALVASPKDVKPTEELTGISQRQIDEHYDVLYKGYVNKINEIESKMPDADLSTANATYSELRELKREEVFTANAIRLHEAYFANLGGGRRTCTGLVLDLINEDFGTYEAWENEFKALGMCARGWVILGFDLEDGKLHTYTSDIHSDGVWGVSPLLVLDVYEHAYMIDYGTARAKYLNAFMSNINWDVVNHRVDFLRIAETREVA